ncbi:MAG: hypothetical protein WCN92_09930 [Eubacteriales bacterium]
MQQSAKNIKYTAVLPDVYIAELKELVATKFIPSVDFGIRLAVKNFITASKSELYQKQMEAAARDKSFIKRTLETQEAFANVDNEVSGQW